MKFEQAFEHFMHSQIIAETTVRRRERLEKGLGHGEKEFLRTIWYPAVGHFEHLYPEWEVSDFANGYRYLDLAYMPGEAKGAIEIQGYGSHARDIEVWRFKDLCIRHCHLALDGWMVMPIAYPSIIETPKQCQQLILSFIGKFISLDVPEKLSCLESETLRFARRLLRPFTPTELSAHLRVSTRHARTLLHSLVDKQLVFVVDGQARGRTYKLHF
ncbi:transcriptional regulator [Paenibacillus radicis (ex Xue et al. 2023)]|uniref:Transcriptional regulator n=1 Tax=Paenibacillus radicis (ex Xue et al. 2023) TaxID=2972489 RepID=A0ABT1YFJ6_9BACL|nr:transcriptional regulator [Paenibacillus radicis (ex Xue et al. 2023)]MCR8631184.1 transcriptional regulator [Paenibacillus radicis (ex Xue et al. 2023)]